MTALVLDASVALAWCFHDEATTSTWSVLDQLESEVAHVPSLFPIEVVNILGLAERKGRITTARTNEFLALLDSLPLSIDRDTAERAPKDVLALVRSEALTAYDACYVELAMRLGLPLATKDMAMRKTARSLGIVLLGV